MILMLRQNLLWSFITRNTLSLWSIFAFTKLIIIMIIIIINNNKSGHQKNAFLSPWLSVLAWISPEQQRRHCLLRVRPLAVPEGNPMKQHITCWVLVLGDSHSCKTVFLLQGLVVTLCNSVADLNMSSNVRFVINFNYRCLLFAPPWQSSSFEQALSSFYQCFYNLPCLLWARGPINEMICSPSNVHHCKHNRFRRQVLFRSV